MGADSHGPWTVCFVGTFPWETNLRRDVHRVFGALAAYSFGPAVERRVQGRYLAIDLYVEV